MAPSVTWIWALHFVAYPDGELAIIDWEGAGPGDRMAELAYAAECFSPLRRDDLCRQLGYVTPPARVERLETFVRGYGLPRGEWSTSPRR